MAGVPRNWGGGRGYREPGAGGGDSVNLGCDSGTLSLGRVPAPLPHGASPPMFPSPPGEWSLALAFSSPRFGGGPASEEAPCQ